MTLIIKTAEDVQAEEKQRARDRITARRNLALVAGTTVEGVRLYTDDVSQARITGAAVAAMDDPTIIVNWKCGDGSFVPLDAPTILMMARAVRAHVQASFDREAVLLAALDAGEPYDIEAGWPE